MSQLARACVRRAASASPSPQYRVFSVAGRIRNASSHTGPPAANTPAATAPPQVTSPDATREAVAPASSSVTGSLLSRLLAPNADGRNSILSALGYYSQESRAIGAANKLYAQAVARAGDAAIAECGYHGAAGRPPFAASFEMLSVHVYLVLLRLRSEKGSRAEAEVLKAMQTLFDVFWTDVRNRMLIKEQGMKLIESGKWVKDCEERFFGMALAFDDCFHDGAASRSETLEAVVSRNVACLGRDPARVASLCAYMRREKLRHDKLPIEDVWDRGLKWGT
jgi:hypothetical protein